MQINILLLLIISVLTILCFIYLSADIVINALSYSPYFSEQQITDNITDWVDMDTNNLIKNGEMYTDITSVNYFSDGKTLNATLWLLFPFKEMPLLKQVGYGILIDADFNSKTGFGGIDYKVEIKWNNETKQWKKFMERWSYYGDTQTIENISNYTNFYEKKLRYVNVELDLNKILYPQKYKVLFFADFRNKDDTLISDYTRWIAIPPLELGITTNPISLELSRGIPAVIEVKVNSTEGYTPNVNLEIENKPPETFFEFHFNNLTLPSYGLATTPITITPTKDAPLGPHTFYIKANSSFTSDELIKLQEIHSVPPANVIERSIVSLTINKEPDIFDNIQNSWQKIGDFTQFIYGVFAGVSPWIYQLIRKLWNKNNAN
jgi:hypothetical protein